MKWIVVAIVIGVVIYVAMRRRRFDTEPSFDTVDEKMLWLAHQAVDMAHKDEVELDFSIDSIAKAEEMLSKLHEQYRTRDNQDGMKGLALAYGAYVGEAIRRSEEDAYWAEDHEVTGPRSFPIHWQGGASFPVSWCYKRMKNGPEDNVWHKYQVLKQQVESENR